MRLLLLACLGGAIGSGARYLVNIAAARALPPEFPWGTLTVNVAGSFLMGFVIQLLALRYDGSPELRILIATGFLGGFTTFSAYSLEVVSLFERGDTGLALMYGCVSVIGSLAALVAGLTLARLLFS